MVNEKPTPGDKEDEDTPDKEESEPFEENKNISAADDHEDEIENPYERFYAQVDAIKKNEEELARKNSLLAQSTHKTKEMLAGAGDKTKEVWAGAGDKTKEALAGASEGAKSMASKVGESTSSIMGKVGEGVKKKKEGCKQQ